MASAFRVLSIDGGGIRGIIPAKVLVDLERRCQGRPIASLFDLIVGTSTGGILALGLTVPNDQRDAPRNSAETLCALYGSEAERIFPGGGKKGWKQRIFGTRNPSDLLRRPDRVMMRSAQTAGAPFGGNPWFGGGARYFASGLEEVLRDQLSDEPLSRALTHVVITSYDMAYGEPILFSSRPLPASITDVSMVQVARATSAGPTYFEPQRLPVNGGQRALVDGGVYVNNPAILGFVLAPVDRPLVLVSLGTGTRNPSSPRAYNEVKTDDWLSVARQVMEAAMTGGGELADALLQNLPIAQARPHRYWRIQTTVGPCNFGMDDSSPGNISCLASVADQLVEDRASDLAEIASAIV